MVIVVAVTLALVGKEVALEFYCGMFKLLALNTCYGLIPSPLLFDAAM